VLHRKHESFLFHEDITNEGQGRGVVGFWCYSQCGLTYLATKTSLPYTLFDTNTTNGFLPLLCFFFIFFSFCDNIAGMPLPTIYTTAFDLAQPVGGRITVSALNKLIAASGLPHGTVNQVLAGRGKDTKGKRHRKELY
jgi:hypothetical protein